MNLLLLLLLSCIPPYNRHGPLLPLTAAAAAALLPVAVPSSWTDRPDDTLLYFVPFFAFLYFFASLRCSLRLLCFLFARRPSAAALRLLLYIRLHAQLAGGAVCNPMAVSFRCSFAYFSGDCVRCCAVVLVYRTVAAAAAAHSIQAFPYQPHDVTNNSLV